MGLSGLNVRSDTLAHRNLSTDPPAVLAGFYPVRSLEAGQGPSCRKIRNLGVLRTFLITRYEYFPRPLDWDRGWATVVLLVRRCIPGPAPARSSSRTFSGAGARPGPLQYRKSSATPAGTRCIPSVCRSPLLSCVCSPICFLTQQTAQSHTRLMQLRLTVSNGAA